MFDVIGTQPATGWHGSERGVQAVHMKQERAVITLDQGRHTTAPIKEIIESHASVYTCNLPGHLQTC